MNSEFTGYTNPGSGTDVAQGPSPLSPAPNHRLARKEGDQ